MEKNNLKVDGLKKVKLLFELGTGENVMDLTPEPRLFEWVVGIGVEGYTPFEYELLGKKAGDTVELKIQGWRLGEIFGRPAFPLPEKARAVDVFFMKATVQDIENADPNEVVRSMAGLVSDCGGDCCGNH